jgi:hypothetical protein
VIYSTAFHDDIRELLYKHGADLCVRKQTDPNALRNILNQIIKTLKEGGAFPSANDTFAEIISVA